MESALWHSPKKKIKHESWINMGDEIQKETYEENFLS